MTPSDNISVYSRLSSFQLWFRRLLILLLPLALLGLGSMHLQWHPEAVDFWQVRLLAIALWLAGIAVSFVSASRLPSLVRRFPLAPAYLLTSILYLILLTQNHFGPDYYIFTLLLLGIGYVGIESLALSLLNGTSLGVFILIALLLTPDPAISPPLAFTFTLAAMMIFSLVKLIRDLQRHQMRFFSSLLSDRLDLALLIKADGDILYAGVSDSSQLLWDPEKPGRLNFFDLVHKDFYQVVSNGFQHVLEGTQPSLTLYIRLADFRLKWHMVEAHMVRITNSLGKPQIALSGTLIDNDQNATEKLQQRSDELRTFIYRTAHDLQGPISTINGLRFLIDQEVKDPVSLRYFDMVFSSAQRMNEALERQLELAEITKDRPPEKESIDFEALARQIIEEVKQVPGLEETDIYLDLPRYIPFFSDKELVRIILRNLVSNAARYRKKADSSHRVRVSLDTVEDQYLIRVEDNGTGIPEKYQERIFEMFYRASNQSVGSGLGLYIVKNSVEKLKGKVILSNSDAQGTVFSVLLPLFEK